MAPGRNLRRTAANSCLHCGRRGHTTNICLRNDYSPDVPALSCTACLRRVITAAGDTQFQMYCGIDPCPQHSTLTAQSPSHSSPSAMAQALSSLTAPGSSTNTPPNAPGTSQPPSATGSSSAPPPYTAAAGPTQPPNPAGPPQSSNPGPAAPTAPQPTFQTRRNNRSFSLPDIDGRYVHVTSLVNGGASLSDALEVTGVPRITFRKWRIVAEARLVDERGFNTLVSRVQNATLEDCVTQGKTILQRASSLPRLEAQFLSGCCLKPIRRA